MSAPYSWYHGDQGWRAETRALIARMIVPPGHARAARYDALIRRLIVTGVWGRLDALYLLAAHDAQAARLNLKSASFTLVPIGAPGFAVDRGYTSDGVSTALSTQFNPVTAGGAFTPHSAHLGCWVLSEGAANTNAMGNANARIFVRTASDAMSGRMNDTIAPAGPPIATSIGHSILNRIAATGYQFVRDGTVLGTAASVASAITDAPIWVCGANGLTPSTLTVAAAHLGGGLTPGEVIALHNAVALFLRP